MTSLPSLFATFAASLNQNNASAQSSTIRKLAWYVGHLIPGEAAQIKPTGQYKAETGIDQKVDSNTGRGVSSNAELETGREVRNSSGNCAGVDAGNGLITSYLKDLPVRGGDWSFNTGRTWACCFYDGRSRCSRRRSSCFGRGRGSVVDGGELDGVSTTCNQQKNKLLLYPRLDTHSDAGGGGTCGSDIGR